MLDHTIFLIVCFLNQERVVFNRFRKLLSIYMGDKHDQTKKERVPAVQESGPFM